MPGHPDHLTEREWRLCLFIEEQARAEDKMREQVRMKFANAAELNLGLHEGAAKALRKVARRIRSGNVPGW